MKGLIMIMLTLVFSVGFAQADDKSKESGQTCVISVTGVT